MDYKKLINEKEMKKVIAISSAIAFVLSVTPAFACGENGCGHHRSNNITVSNENYASVSNTVSTSANTGDNNANGGNASGKHSTGGNGGEIWTGDAGALSSVVNIVNSNITRIR